MNVFGRSKRYIAKKYGLNKNTGDADKLSELVSNDSSQGSPISHVDGGTSVSQRRETVDAKKWDANESSVSKARRRKKKGGQKVRNDEYTRVNNPNSHKWLPKGYSWGPESVAQVMTQRPTQDALEADLTAQNVANAIVWENTMFGGVSPVDTSDQARVLRQQQAFLKRHFLAMASLGVQGGDQDNDKYAPLEEFLNGDDIRVNLATVSSGGGRFNYRSTEGSGDKFHQFLFFDDQEVNQDQLPLKKVSMFNPIPATYNDYKEKGDESLPKTFMGAYERVSTHAENLDTTSKSIKEIDTTDVSWGFNPKGEDAWGFDIPLGGRGVNLTTVEGKQIKTGYQGRAIDDDGNDYQTGAGLYRYNSNGKLGSVMVAFENSGPKQKNIHGVGHGLFDTVKKKLERRKEEKEEKEEEPAFKGSATGQGKRRTWQLSHVSEDPSVRDYGKNVSKEGGIKADITQGSLALLRERWKVMGGLPQDAQQDFYRRLLLTTKREERKDLFNRFGLPNEVDIRKELSTRTKKKHRQSGPLFLSNMSTPQDNSNVSDSLLSTPQVKDQSMDFEVITPLVEDIESGTEDGL